MSTSATSPDGAALPHEERRLIRQLRTPAQVQRYLNALPYNQEPHGRATLRSFQGVVRHRCAHCLEAALFAAVVLEHHGHAPRLLSFESIDQLDHVIFVYQQRGRWGSIARSRDPGLHGRRAVFATPRALALSYVDPYVDYTGRVTGYAVVDLKALMGDYDWRFALTNVWKVERMLLAYPHRRIRTSDTRFEELKRRYKAFRTANGGRKPLYYSGRERWSELPYDPEHWQMDNRRTLNRDQNPASASKPAPDWPAAAPPRTAAITHRRASSRFQPTAERSPRAAPPLPR